MSAEDTETDGSDEELRYFVRIEQTDLDGTKSVERALSELPGIGRRTARIVAQNTGIDRRATLGRLDDDEIDAIIEEVTGFADANPNWLANRQEAFYTGETTHEIGNDVELSRRRDINRLQMIRAYRGIRHERGQKVRGQRTKSTGRSEGTIGVNVEQIREEEAEEAAAAEEEED